MIGCQLLFSEWPLVRVLDIFSLKIESLSFSEYGSILESPYGSTGISYSSSSLISVWIFITISCSIAIGLPTIFPIAPRWLAIARRSFPDPWFVQRRRGPLFFRKESLKCPTGTRSASLEVSWAWQNWPRKRTPPAVSAEDQRRVRWQPNFY